jgi:hypothetical protein
VTSGLRRGVAAAGAAALLALVVIGAAVQRFPPIASVAVNPGVHGDPPSDDLIPSPVFGRLKGGDDWSDVDLRWLGILLSVIAAVALILLVARVVAQLVRRIRGRSRRQTDSVAGLVGGGESVEQARVPVIEAGVEAARASLESYQEPSDAILAAWLELEDAARDSGLERTPAQTPAEFTVAVLARTGADPEATTELLELYHRARFSSHPTTHADVRRASDCLVRIAASWPAPLELAAR